MFSFGHCRNHTNQKGKKVKNYKHKPTKVKAGVKGLEDGFALCEKAEVEAGNYTIAKGNCSRGKWRELTTKFFELKELQEMAKDKRKGLVLVPLIGEKTLIPEGSLIVLDGEEKSVMDEKTFKSLYQEDKAAK